MGESKLKKAKQMQMRAVHTRCAGRRTAPPRRWGLAYFIEFLTLTGLWSGWQERCPLSYTSPNAPSKADVLGTWMLSILSGHRRYSHVTTIRCDGVNSAKVISEDALRLANPKG
jgi:hypothetical protein